MTKCRFCKQEIVQKRPSADAPLNWWHYFPEQPKFRQYCYDQNHEATPPVEASEIGREP